MIKVKQLAHVCMFTDNLEETRAFYRDVFGMETKFNFLRDGKIFGFHLECGGGHTTVEYFEKTDASYSEKNQINHFCLEVEDIQEAVAHIESKGVKIWGKRLACDDTWQAWLNDPNGVSIELFQYTDKSAELIGGDRVADW